MRPFLHYLFSIVILSVYGGQVCPYIATLDISRWVVSLLLAFGAAFIARRYLVSSLVENAPYELQVKRQFIIEFALFIGASMALTIYDLLVYDFPLASGIKIMLGAATLGFFASADTALERERIISRKFGGTGEELKLDKNFFPLTTKFILTASFSIIFVTAIVALVISRDIMLLTLVDQDSLRVSSRAVIIELAFIGVVVLIEAINLIISYSTNLKLFFGNENATLSAVAGGDMSSRVPVSTNDEFGVMATYTNQMISTLKSRTDELVLTQDVTILTLASLAETRDNETGAHILRTQRYVKALADHLKDKPGFSAHLDDEFIELLFKSAPLHDIGKVGVPDAILLKPGKLTPEEFEEMKRHTIYGRDSLRYAEKILGSTSFLRLAEEIAISHHEKWDATGYPNGLKGDQIPVAGRLMALADVYDALISKRVYKKAFSHEKAKEIIVEGSGKHFDPSVVNAFIELEKQFMKIASDYADGRAIEHAA